MEILSKIGLKIGGSNHNTTVAVDMRRGVVQYYSRLGSNAEAVDHKVKNYVGKTFDDEFFAKFKDALATFMEAAPTNDSRKISLIIPDEAIALDCLRLPTMRSAKHLQNALDVKLSEIYSNRDDLEINTNLADKNRQFSTYNVVALQKRIISDFSAACAENKLIVDSLTFASAATAAAVSVLSPAWKNQCYLFLDIKDVYSRFTFVVNGRAVGFYSLPFGLELLSKKKYVQEDMLFDHSYAELVVLNAKERAKAKKLSMLAETSDDEHKQVVDLESMLVINDSDEDDEPMLAKKPQEKQAVAASDVKIMAKKAPRKLPQFMLRPIPITVQEICRENFRTFVKWALTLIEGNQILVEPHALKCVLVNLPKEFTFVFDALKEEEEETGIPFVRFDGADDKGELAQNLELLGGLNAKAWHTSAKF